MSVLMSGMHTLEQMVQLDSTHLLTILKLSRECDVKHLLSD